MDQVSVDTSGAEIKASAHEVCMDSISVKARVRTLQCGIVVYCRRDVCAALADLTGFLPSRPFDWIFSVKS